MSAVTERYPMGGRFRLACYADAAARARGDAPLWVRDQHNLVTEAGRTYLTSAGLLAGTAVTTWYVGLTDGTPTVAAGDTMSSHAGWTEVTAYSEATRPTWVGIAGGTAGSATNAASEAAFTANGTATVGGLFLTSVSTKGGTTGTLLCAAALSGGDQPVVSGNVLTATYAWTGVDDGV